MPPGPPPGPPPKHLHHNKNMHSGQNLKQVNNHKSPCFTIIYTFNSTLQSDPKSATITAKPQIR